MSAGGRLQGGGLRAYAILYLLFLYAPILLLPVFAFNSGTIIAFPLKGLTTEWFAQMWGNATLRRALLSAEALPEGWKELLAQRFGATVFDHYGATETGYGVGVECEAFCGYHLRETDIFFEIVDMVTGAPLPDGEVGEVAFTTLTPRGMPFVRYRTGDAARMLPGQ